MKSWSLFLKPSPYFADSFAFFFKRFLSEDSLFRWFVKKAGNESAAFRYPFKLFEIGNLFIWLPENADEILASIPFLKSLAKLKSHGVLLLANTQHENLLTSSRISQEIAYYTTKGLRYGEEEFQKIQSMLLARKMAMCICLEQNPRFQQLYLAKVCGAAYRFGFNCEKFYPLLNLSLSSLEDSEKKASFLTELFKKASA